MATQKLKKNLETNIKIIKDEFNDDLLKRRDIVNINNQDVKISLLYFGLLANRDFIQTSIVKPVLDYLSDFPQSELIEFIEKSLIISSEVKASSDIKEVTDELMFGKTILFVEGYDQCLIIETNDRVTRTPNEPDAEATLRGPREGFTESLMTNISLLRRKILNPDLKFHYLKVGKETNVYLSYTYIDSLVDTRALHEFEDRLNKINLDAVLDTNTITEAISNRGISPFEIIGQTERPDTLASKLLEGKIGVMMDGSPVALTLPFLFVENFQTNEDYYINSFFVSFARIVRILGFIISTLLPGVYVAVISFHWEIVPTRMALSIAQAQEGLSLPTSIEAFIMLIAFEITRETGIRTPSGLGQSMSIVGTLVIGQAAIQARLASPFMVIVVALTAITGLINYKLKGATIFIRFILLLAGSIMGLFGVFIVGFLVVFHIASINSFGVQYMERGFPMKKGNLKDSILRVKGEGVSKLDDNKEQ